MTSRLPSRVLGSFAPRPPTHTHPGWDRSAASSWICPLLSLSFQPLTAESSPRGEVGGQGERSADASARRRTSAVDKTLRPFTRRKSLS